MTSRRELKFESWVDETSFSDLERRVRLQQPGPICGACSVAALCGNSGSVEFHEWIRHRRLLHVKCPVCERHGSLSVRTGAEVFPVPEDCPVALIGKEHVKICIPCYRGQQIKDGGAVEPEF